MNALSARALPSIPRRLPRMPKIPEGWINGVVLMQGERLVAMSYIGADWKDPTGWSFLLGSFSRRH